MIVMPERETPGMSARLCAKPIAIACRATGRAMSASGRRAVGDPEHDGEDGEQDRDLPRLAEVLGDRVLAERARRQRPGTVATATNQAIALGRRLDPPPARALASHATTSSTTSSPEVADDRDERPEVQRDVERLVELVVRLEVRPVREPRDEDQMARGRDRQELREPLDDAEHERLPVRQRAGRLTRADGRQHDRDDERRAGADDRVRRGSCGPVIVCEPVSRNEIILTIAAVVLVGLQPDRRRWSCREAEPELPGRRIGLFVAVVAPLLVVGDAGRGRGLRRGGPVTTRPRRRTTAGHGGAGEGGGHDGGAAAGRERRERPAEPHSAGDPAARQGDLRVRRLRRLSHARRGGRDRHRRPEPRRGEAALDARRRAVTNGRRRDAALRGPAVEEQIQDVAAYVVQPRPRR